MIDGEVDGQSDKVESVKDCTQRGREVVSANHLVLHFTLFY